MRSTYRLPGTLEQDLEKLAERTRLFDQQAAQQPFFDGYRKTVVTREIPVIVFERIG